MHRKIRSIENAADTEAKHVLVPEDPSVSPKECTHWKSVETPAEVEKFLIERNRKHFGQAKGTFPTTAPLSEEVDWGAFSHAAELTLEGNCDDADISEAGRLMVSYMSATTELDSIHAQLTGGAGERNFVGLLLKFLKN